MYGTSKQEILNSFTLDELYKYLDDGTYWKYDDLGIKYKRPKTVEQVEIQKERDAQLKARYKKIRAKSGK